MSELRFNILLAYMKTMRIQVLDLNQLIGSLLYGIQPHVLIVYFTDSNKRAFALHVYTTKHKMRRNVSAIVCVRGMFKYN